jgi:2-iminobutanoate/2-iminopropanoate deaminase
MERKIVKTAGAFDPMEVGHPLSQAVRLGDIVFTSGVTPRDPKTGELVGGEIEQQTERVMLNLKAILEAAGSSMEKVAKVTVFLSDIKNWERMNTVYRKFFPKDPPARAAFEVSGLAADCLVEIQMIAGV